MNENIQLRQMTSTEIIEELSRHRGQLRRLGLRKLGLFGSYERGSAGPGSDLDFLADFTDVSFDAYMDTKFFLEDLFHCPVDLVLEHNLKPRLRPYILNEVEYVPGL